MPNTLSSQKLSQSSHALKPASSEGRLSRSFSSLSLLSSSKSNLRPRVNIEHSNTILGKSTELSQTVILETNESQEPPEIVGMSDDSPHYENYTLFPNETVAKLLFLNELPGLNPEKTCQIIGKKYLFSLYWYLTLLATLTTLSYSRRISLTLISRCHSMTPLGTLLRVSYHNLTLRRFCKHLKLSGETQVIDRVLLQFSNQYWESNEEFRELFKSIGNSL